MSASAAGVLSDLPAEVARGLEDFVAAARDAFGERLESIVLFGSAAEGALRATSDVNLVLVLRAFVPAEAERLRGAFRVAHAALELRAMFLLGDELRRPPRPSRRNSMTSGDVTACCGAPIHSPR